VHRSQKLKKHPYFLSGEFKAIKVMNVDTIKKLVSNCNSFHTSRANTDKITTFLGVPVFDARLRRRF